MRYFEPNATDSKINLASEKSLKFGDFSHLLPTDINSLLNPSTSVPLPFRASNVR